MKEEDLRNLSGVLDEMCESYNQLPELYNARKYQQMHLCIDYNRLFISLTGQSKIVVIPSK